MNTGKSHAEPELLRLTELKMSYVRTKAALHMFTASIHDTDVPYISDPQSVETVSFSMLF